MEQSRDRKEDLAELEDPRVDLCIFCIPPHRCAIYNNLRQFCVHALFGPFSEPIAVTPLLSRLRPIDLKYMFELGKHVPVVPVVTKADTMTIREANTYRTEVANRIANPMVPGRLGSKWQNIRAAVVLFPASLSEVRIRLGAKFCCRIQAFMTRSTSSSLSVTRWSVRACRTRPLRTRLSS